MICMQAVPYPGTPKGIKHLVGLLKAADPDLVLLTKAAVTNGLESSDAAATLIAEICRDTIIRPGPGEQVKGRS